MFKSVGQPVLIGGSMGTASYVLVGTERGLERSFGSSCHGRAVAEEAPGAYKDVTAVVEAADRAGLSHAVARLEPLICIKG